MKTLTAGQLQENWEKIIQLITDTFSGERQEKLLEMYAKDYNLDLEKVYNHHQLGKIKLHSYSSTSRKNKYVIECENGKKYKVDYISARKWFGGKPTEGSLTLRDINGRAINE